jgi:hypothetical protein
MSKSSSRRFPVTVSQLPVIRCQICRRTVAHQPGKASEVLTEHYRRAHPKSSAEESPVKAASATGRLRCQKNELRSWSAVGY